MEGDDRQDGAPETTPLDFLLATRIRYELHCRPPVPSPGTAAAPDAEAEAASGDVERDLRAAEFLLATRALREANERAAKHPDGSAKAPPR